MEKSNFPNAIKIAADHWRPANGCHNKAAQLNKNYNSAINFYANKWNKSSTHQAWRREKRSQLNLKQKRSGSLGAQALYLGSFAQSIVSHYLLLELVYNSSQLQLGSFIVVVHANADVVAHSCDKFHAQHTQVHRRAMGVNVRAFCCCTCCSFIRIDTSVWIYLLSDNKYRWATIEWEATWNKDGVLNRVSTFHKFTIQFYKVPQLQFAGKYVKHKIYEYQNRIPHS